MATSGSNGSSRAVRNFGGIQHNAHQRFELLRCCTVVLNQNLNCFQRALGGVVRNCHRAIGHGVRDLDFAIRTFSGHACFLRSHGRRRRVRHEAAGGIKLHLRCAAIFCFVAHFAIRFAKRCIDCSKRSSSRFTFAVDSPRLAMRSSR